jgi:hypothetical protein
MMLFRTLTLFLCILLTACPIPADRKEVLEAVSKEMDNQRKTFGALSEADCKLHNGIWRGVKNAEFAVCDETAPDAGNPCSDSSECEVFCSTQLIVEAGSKVSGKCFNDYVAKGCTQSISNGVANPIICN